MVSLSRSSSSSVSSFGVMGPSSSEMASSSGIDGWSDSSSRSFLASSSRNSRNWVLTCRNISCNIFLSGFFLMARRSLLFRLLRYFSVLLLSFGNCASYCADRMPCSCSMRSHAVRAFLSRVGVVVFGGCRRRFSASWLVIFWFRISFFFGVRYGRYRSGAWVMRCFWTRSGLSGTDFSESVSVELGDSEL